MVVGAMTTQGIPFLSSWRSSEKPRQPASYPHMTLAGPSPKPGTQASSFFLAFLMNLSTLSTLGASFTGSCSMTESSSVSV